MSFFTKKAKPGINPTFVTPAEVFQPQVEVFTTRDISGWANREKGIKFHLQAGKSYCVDADTAREWQVKGYVHIVHGEVKPVSADEKAEILSTVREIKVGF